MKNIIKSIGDLKISILLFLLFALFCALATFIESSYGTPTAWAMIYGTLWFGLIQFLLGINLFFGMLRYKMFQIKKIPLMVFHFSFLFILIGSIMTRYGGFEGLLHIRENDSNSYIESSKSFIKFSALKNQQVYGIASDKDIAVLPFANSLKLELNLDKDKAILQYKDLILNAKVSYIEDLNSSNALLVLMFAKDGQNQEIKLKQNEVKNIDGINFSFMNDEVRAPFVKINKNLELSSSERLNFLSMQDGINSHLEVNSKANAKEKRLYEINNLSFVIKFASLHAKEIISGDNRPQDESFLIWFKNIWLEIFRTLIISWFGEPHNWKASWLENFKSFAMSTQYQALNLNGNNALKLELSYQGQKQEFYVFEYDKPKVIELNGQKFFISWTISFQELPFSIYLKDFIIDRYPGSMSPASYASEIKIEDNNISFDYRVFMNNVLDYRGYRFYQSSYDQDEKGTILSVNKDPGKIPTYIGYFLLCLGMFLNFLNPHSRFRTLAKLINQDALKNSAKILLFAFLFLGINKLEAFENNISNIPVINKEHAQKLSHLIVQKSGGRMVPFDTLAKEVLEKIYKKTTYKNQDASAVMLSMLIDVQSWAREPIIIMPKNKAINEEISKILNIPSKPYISYMDFFTKDNNYALLKYVENANRKNPNTRGVLDKEIIKLDERANIVNLIFSGELFKFIPLQNDKNNTWVAPFSAMQVTKGEENLIVLNLIKNYFLSVEDSIKTNDWSKADEALELIEKYQEKFGGSIMPNQTKISIEIFTNHLQLFVKLIPVYLLAGLLLLILVLTKMLNSNIKINLIFKIVYILNIIVFIIHSIGLCLRAYLADHAPWSNAYESMVYISWALALSGIFFSKKSPIALSLTSILAGIVLFVAHLSEMDPQITNLVPVLNSYWLTIHVSVITASYGFLGLCALLAIFTLVLMCFLKDGGKYNANILRNITEATRINEMAMILGLCLLTAGNFLGAIWANESWGRYWSWDSKETWALISILIYAAILHIRMIPKLCNQYNFAVSSMFAYWVIIMTYFGVNYFLVGMHSYAAGEAVQIPSYVYWGFFMMIVLSLLAYKKRHFVSKL